MNAAPDDAATTSAALTGHRLLLVEDDEVAAGALSELLHHFGFQVTVAPTVSTAMQLLKSRPFDQAVLDLMLPDGLGSEVLTEIRSRGLPIRVVVTSASSDRDLLAKTKLAGPDAFLAKPLDVGKLIGALGA